jgi:hypothetical protein
MSFRITGLKLAQFAALIALPEDKLPEHNARRVVADRSPGFPCRVSLIDAQPGERVLLVNYEHLPVASPYRSRHAIYVREDAREVCYEVGEVPPVLQHRLLSVRAFTAEGMMVDADVAEGRQQLVPLIERLLSPAEVAYLHVHNARAGCYAARVDRAGARLVPEVGVEPTRF